MPKRCPAADIDTDPCIGPTDALLFLDDDNSGVDACEHHAAKLLSRFSKGRVVGNPSTPFEVVARVFKAGRR